MGAMCCNSEENFIFPLEEMMSDLLSRLRIRNLSEEEMRRKIKSLFIKTDDDRIIVEKLRGIFIDTNPQSNPNIYFHNKFFDKFIAKCETLNNKNIIIMAYPLLSNKRNLKEDNFFILLKEKLEKEYNYEEVSKTLIKIVEFYTYDLTEILGDSFEKNEKEIVRDILQKSYSKNNIKNFVYYAMEKDKMESSGLWKTPVTFEIFNPIMKTIGISDNAVIRTNLMFYER